MVAVSSYYLVLVGLLFGHCQAAAISHNDNSTSTTVDPYENKTPVDEPPMEKVHVNTTLYMGIVESFTCTKHRLMTPRDVDDAFLAMDKHYYNGEWGQRCYDGWCVESKSIANWDSPKDCMRESRIKLYECLQQSAGDGYMEQIAGLARCRMHYWCEGC